MASLTFSGQDADVTLDDGTITFVPGGAGTTGASAGDPVVIPRSEVAGVDLKPASLLAYGRLVISTRSGDEHTVQFAREDQDRFANLEAIIRP